MLVNKRQEWDIYQEQTAPSAKKPLPLKNNGLRAKCVKLLFLIAVVAMMITVQTESIVRSGYELVELKAQAAALEKENEALRLEVAKLKSPQRIQRIATNELGMVLPKNVYCASIQNTPSSNDSAKETKAAAGSLAVFAYGKAEANKGR